MTREAELSRVFVELADTLVADFDMVEFLHTLTRRCIDLFEIDAASLMVADQHGQLRLVASSAEQVKLLELIELQSEGGPCLDSFRTGRIVTVEDVSGAGPWPVFQQEMAASNYRAVQALPLRLRGRMIGALNLFRGEPGALEGQDLLVCQAIADVATIGFLQARAVHEAQVLAEQLSVALTSRVIIEQAKGIIAARTNQDVDEAFRLLRSYARRHNLRLAALARDVVDRNLDLTD